MKILDLVPTMFAALPLPPFNDIVRGVSLLMTLGSLSYMIMSQIPVPEFYVVIVTTYSGYYFGHQQARLAYQERRPPTP